MLGFRTRDPERDKSTDRERMRRLATLLDELSEEIEKERNGLQRRMDAQSTDAGFLDQGMQNGDVAVAGGERLDALTKALLGGEKRLVVLRHHAVILSRMRKEMDKFQSLADS